jgi:hypothetical protein
MRRPLDIILLAGIEFKPGFDFACIIVAAGTASTVAINIREQLDTQIREKMASDNITIGSYRLAYRLEDDVLISLWTGTLPLSLLMIEI